MKLLLEAEYNDLVTQAARFNYLQTCGPITAANFFWNHSDPEKRAAAIDNAIEARRGSHTSSNDRADSARGETA